MFVPIDYYRGYSGDVTQVDDLIPTFTGSDIKAIIVRRDDDVLIRQAINYLQSINSPPPVNFPLFNDDPFVLAGAGKTTADFDISNHGKFSTNDTVPIAPSPVPSRLGSYDYVPYNKENLISLINLQTITISTYRVKQQVRALGQVNPRGIARGSRTIAGTIILAEFDRDAFWKLVAGDPLNAVPLGDNNIGDAGESVLPDQVAPFNLLLLFSNEMGFHAYRMIYEIELVTNGIVYSIQDMYHENTVGFICTDVTPLTPLPKDDMQMRGLIAGNTLSNSFSPLNSVTSAKELVKRYRLLKNSRKTTL